MRVQRFEDLIAWQKARTLAQAIYQASRKGTFAKDFGLSGQIQRAAVSTMSNIAEGFERGSRREFQYVLSIAKASCAEVRSQLYLAFDVGHLNQDSFDKLLTQAEELSRVIGGLLASIKGQKA
jgi:four helix bundle protein